VKTIKQGFALLHTISFLIIISFSAKAQDSIPDYQLIVADVGQGLCVVGKEYSSGRLFVYDSGRKDNKICFEILLQIAGGARKIDLLILSHSDSDHIGNARYIFRDFSVDTVLISGSERWDTEVWREMNLALAETVRTKNTSVINLSTFSLPELMNFQIGDDAFFQFLYGGINSFESSLFSSLSKKRNALSIVGKLMLGKTSILLTGDTVGGKLGSCGGSEKKIVEKFASELKSDILIAPHHGAENSSSECLINAVIPSDIIISAGHHGSYRHPKKTTIERMLLLLNLSESNIWRTDLQDDEGDDEWEYMRVKECNDAIGDDSVNIKINYSSSSKSYIISYLEPHIQKCK
jgi:beta-lactamase superfamily II metal-dependent hydrolase